MRNSTEDPLPDLLADIEELVGCESPSTAAGPPLPAESSEWLFTRARAVAADLGLPALTRAATGGGADADDEHVLIADLPGRLALVRDLLSRERMP